MRAHTTLTEGSLKAHVRKGREGKGREQERKDVVLIHLQTVPARLGEWMTADAASIGGVTCR